MDFFKNLIENINIFDFIFFIIIIYSMMQCFVKGFSLSILSFMKWIFSLIITIYLVPKLQPWVAEYIESEFVNNVGLGILIFVLSLFVMILLSKSLNKAVNWTGLGSIDKIFGLFFGIFKGYVISVCIFSIANWFYPYQNWGISAEKAITFKVIKNGNELLIEEFPNTDKFKDTKDKIEKI